MSTQNKNTDKVEIPLSKMKLLFGLACSIMFVVLGSWILTSLADQQTRFSPELVKGIGIAGIVFFGITGLYGLKKLFDKSIGLTIDDDGIIDHTNASSVGRIPWEDITKIRTEQVMSTRFLLIYLNNPDSYIEKIKGMKRRLMAANMRMYGTPLSITSTTLKYDFNQLEKLIADKLNEHKSKVSSS